MGVRSIGSHRIDPDARVRCCGPAGVAGPEWFVPVLGEATSWARTQAAGDVLTQDADGWIRFDLVADGDRSTIGDWAGTNGARVLTWPTIDTTGIPADVEWQAIAEIDGNLANLHHVMIGFAPNLGEIAPLAAHRVAGLRGGGLTFDSSLFIFNNGGSKSFGDNEITERHVITGLRGWDRAHHASTLTLDTLVQGGSDANDEYLVNIRNSPPNPLHLLVACGSSNGTTQDTRVRPWFRRVVRTWPGFETP